MYAAPYDRALTVWAMLRALIGIFSSLWETATRAVPRNDPMDSPFGAVSPMWGTSLEPASGARENDRISTPKPKIHNNISQSNMSITMQKGFNVFPTV